jgi:hypothetical protein
VLFRATPMTKRKAPRCCLKDASLRMYSTLPETFLCGIGPSLWPTRGDQMPATRAPVPAFATGHNSRHQIWIVSTSYRLRHVGHSPYDFSSWPRVGSRVSVPPRLAHLSAKVFGFDAVCSDYPLPRRNESESRRHTVGIEYY